jgi:hypothetical protein
MPEHRPFARSALIWFLVILSAALVVAWLSFQSADDNTIPSPTATWTRAEPLRAVVTPASGELATTEAGEEPPSTPTELFSPLPEPSPWPSASPLPTPFASPTPVSYPLPTLPPPTPYPEPEGG